VAAISPLVYSGPYTANGTQTAFPFYFSIMEAGGILVLLDGSPVTVGFTVTVGLTSGMVNFGAPPIAGTVVMLESNPDFIQTSEFENEGAYKLTTVNSINRRSAVRDNYLLDRIQRSLVTPRATDLVAYMKSLLGPIYKGDPGGNVMSVGPFSTVAGLSIPVGTDLIQTSGATRGQLIADTSLTDADVAAYPLAIVKTSNGRLFRRDQQDLRGAQFGMDPAATDNSAALSALIAYQIFRPVNAAQGLRGGASATFGAGIYSFTQDISIKGGTFAWSGSSGSTGYGLGSATVFQMVGAVGFTLHRSDTPDAIIPFGGDGFISNNICYRGSATGTKPVFTAHSRFHFRHSSCINGGSHGLAVIADVGATALSGLRGEASISTIFSGAFSGNGGSGILFSGGDANACKAYGYDAVGNQRYGIEDLSFLGNTFDGHHRDNVLGPYFANNPNAGTLALGTYTESGQPPAQLGGRGLVIGGTQAAGWTYNTAIFFAENGAPASNGLMTRRLSADGLTTLTVSFALDAAGGAIWSGGRTGYTGSAIERFRGADVVRSLDYSDASVSYLWTGAGTTMLFGRAAIVPNVHVFYNFSLGTRIWAEGTAAPTTGSHAQGERVWNTAPIAGGTEGWVCVTSGTPGTWKTFGSIAP
jgi:hypothetical protein